MSFSGRSVIVTGASRGVGKAIAVELGRRGAHVVCAARAGAENPLRLPGTVDETARLVTEAGGVGLAVPCDLTGDDDVVVESDGHVQNAVTELVDGDTSRLLDKVRDRRGLAQ